MVDGGGGGSGVQVVVAVVILVKVVVVKSDARLRGRVVVVVLVDDERLADRMVRVVVEVRLVPVISAAAVRILVAVAMLSMMRRVQFVDVVATVVRLLVVIEVGQEIVYFCQELLVAN